MRIGAGALFSSSAASVRRLSIEDAQIRAALPVNRRIGFVQLTPEAGCSSLAAQVAGVFARRRAGQVLGVNASAGPNNLIAAAGLSAHSADRPNAVRLSARSASEAFTDLRQAPTGLRVQDLRTSPDAEASVSDWTDQIAPISRFFDLTVTDWGLREPDTDLGAIVAASHIICLVARADRYSAERAAALVPAIQAHQASPAVVVALVDVDGAAGQAPSSMLRDENLPICVIPYDPNALRPGVLPPRGRSMRARRATASLAAALLDVGIPTAQPLEAAS